MLGWLLRPVVFHARTLYAFCRRLINYLISIGANDSLVSSLAFQKFFSFDFFLIDFVG